LIFSEGRSSFPSDFLNLGRGMLPFWIDPYEKINSSQTLACTLIKTERNPGRRRVNLDYRVIVCSEQSKGYGTNGKVWVSEKGNVFLSIIIPLDFFTTIHLGQLSLATGLGLVQVVQSLCPKASVLLKWPNDVLLNSKKVAGILVEICEEYTVIGVGLNTVSAPSSVKQATCLQDHQPLYTDRENIFRDILQKLSFIYEVLKNGGFGLLRKECLRVSSHLRSVFVVANKRGRFVDIGEHGEMILVEKGRRHIVVSLGSTEAAIIKPETVVI
jgi:BirA family biotin operon repressor/biotin-[acetyl-CoA-carboxylase] ligase